MNKLIIGVFLILFSFCVKDMPVNANAGSTQSVSSASEEQLTVANFVNELKSVNLSSNPQLAQTRDFWANYYSKVKIVKTIVGNGYIVDCVPFEQQPALFNADLNTVNAAKQANNQHHSQVTKLEGAEFDMSQCPPGTVAIVRPQVNSFKQNQLNAFTKQLGFVTSSVDSSGPKGYQYVQYQTNLSESPNFIKVDYATTNNAWIALGGNTNPTITPYNNGTNSHVINQLWWLTKPGSEKGCMSLEAGWINSTYFSNNASGKSFTTLFTYSTTDNYAGGPSDAYDSGGGFIQYANVSIVPGLPMDNISYVIAYEKVAAGFELDLYPISSNGSIGNKIAVGYYPYTRYPNGVNENFCYFGGGAEVYIDKGYDVTLSGTLYGLGTNFNGNLAESIPLNLASTAPKFYTGTTQEAFGRPAIVFSGSNQ